METALVVDDDVLMREFIVETLRRDGIAVTQMGNGIEAKKVLESRDFDLAFVDLKMPGMDGMQLLRHMKEENIQTLVVMVTAFGTVEQAVEAMKLGAYDFLMKPFSPEQVELVIKRARELVRLHAENEYLQEELGWKLPQGREILGDTSEIQKIMGSIKQVAASSSTVLVSGESGTGKELVAHAIHMLSNRSDKPFVRMNCAAVPDTLMDSELFGHEKGAFTGAVARRLGRFELAAGGSLLLDEVSEMKIGLQGKLLRVLQEQEFERVGGSKTLKANVRIIATTNRNLAEHIQAGEFRQDLFYRLNVLPIHVPALRERKEDIPVLANAFLERFRNRCGGSHIKASFTDEALRMMTAYSWPGNVRELENLVERLSVMAPGPVLGAEVLPPEITGSATAPSVTVAMPAGNAEVLRLGDEAPQAGEATEGSKSLPFDLGSIERKTILEALGVTGGNRQETATLLGISVRTLRNKINQYREQGVTI
ncbi:hypothetical protein BVX97_01490 [bacterium E08(2017)]|nr:hypothetical protein BVX97_01490 [bacterium E08(2017)]